MKEMRRSILSLVAAFSVCLVGAQSHDPSSATRYRIETDSVYQSIDGFGASDAWSVQFVGQWPLEKQRKAADWLFSCENNADGQPRGIGLSIWRFNVGAGSHAQGDSSQIKPNTRTDCFLNENGTYDWDRQAGQRSFLRLAKERGVPTFVAFLNSPPIFFTKNGLATNIGGDESATNLRADRHDAFVRFMADVVEGMKRKEGVTFDYLAPFNEPEWAWNTSKQEGCPATNRDIAEVVRALGKELVARKMDTKILISESGGYRFLYEEPYRRPANAYQLEAFFNPAHPETYVGNVPNLPRLMAAHSYWTTTPLSDLRQVRIDLGRKAKEEGVQLWQSEVCIMDNDKEIGGGNGFDFSMQTALYVARLIHHDLVYAHVRSWQWWLAFGSTWKDGLIWWNKERQELKDARLLWAMGHYSRFVRPGAVRLGVSSLGKAAPLPEGDTDPHGLMCSAYRNADGSLAMVLINYAEEERPFLLEPSQGTAAEWSAYRTSDREGETLKPVGKVQAGEVVRMPARSLLTLVAASPVR